MVKADSATEFDFLPTVDPITHEPIPEVRHNSNADVLLYCDIGQGSALRQTHDECLTFLNDMRKFAVAPLHEQRKRLSAEYPCLGEEVLHILRTISFIDHEYFGSDIERLRIDSDMERYAQAFLAALLSVKMIRKLEERYYRLDDAQYSVHFDIVNREVIIAKLPRAGLIGFLQRKTRRGYGIESWRKAIHIGEVNFTH